MPRVSHTSLLALGVFAICIAVFAFTLFEDTNTVEATHDTPLTFHSPVELHGYAWSDTIGWISFNCAEGSPTGGSICGTNDYKVEIIPDSNPADTILGSIEGYAWSDSIGWIKFGGLSNFPSNTYGNAEIRLTAGNHYMYGWARACAGTQNGNCSTMSDNADGWDGWISLNSLNVGGAPVTYSVSMTGTSFGGHAWGSDVVGWIDMDGVSYTPAPASGSLSITGCTITQGNSTCMGSFTWEIIGASSPRLWWSNPGIVLSTSTSGVGVQFMMEYGMQWYKIRDGWSIIRMFELQIDCAPGLAFDGTSCEPIISIVDINGSLSVNATLVRKTSSAKLTWSIDNPLDVTSCSLVGSNGDTFSGLSGTNVDTAPLTFAQTVYTLTCIPLVGGSAVEVASTTIKTLPIISET